MQIRGLQLQLLESNTSHAKSGDVIALERLLADANKAKNRYQADYMEAHKNNLKLQANLEQVRAQRGSER
jgi:protein HOOK3